MSDLGGIMLDLGLVNVQMSAVLLCGVLSSVQADLMTHSHTLTEEQVRAQRESDASSGGSRAVDVGSGRCKA